MFDLWVCACSFFMCFIHILLHFNLLLFLLLLLLPLLLLFNYYCSACFYISTVYFVWLLVSMVGSCSYNVCIVRRFIAANILACVSFSLSLDVKYTKNTQSEPGTVCSVLYFVFIVCFGSCCIECPIAIGPTKTLLYYYCSTFVHMSCHFIQE